MEACRDARIPNLVGPGCRLLFVGINPGLQTALTGIHFAHPSNRFWPALRRAGLIDWAPNLSPATPAVRIRIDDPPSERFHPMSRAGLIDAAVDPEQGMTDEQRDDFTTRGMGITNLVDRATTRAAELGRGELRAGGERLCQLVEELSPQVVAVAGVTAYRDAFAVRSAGLGRQPDDLGTAQLWVVPNPSGLNAHETIDSLAEWYRTVAGAAGIL